jgi:hypothetical protein
MRDLERRLAKLEVASMGPARMHFISIGCDCDDAEIDRAVAQLVPDRRPDDTVVIVRRYSDPRAPAQLSALKPVPRGG